MGTHLRLSLLSTMAPYERKAEEEMRMQDVQKMCLDDGKAMVVVDGRVYDLTMWKHAHPGGETIINDFVGQDASDAFRVFHPEEVREKMKVFDKGAVSDYVRSPISEDFKELHEAFLEEGLYDSYMPYFVAKFVGCLVALAGALYLGWNAEALGGNYSWAVVAAGATLLALHFHQLAFLGHNGVTHVREYDYLFSLTVGGALGGISSGWWKRSHNVHHCVTNSVNHDPDIQHLPVFGLSEKHLDGFFSTFHNRFMPYDAVADMFIRVQHYLYYPIMAVARFNLYLQSWIMLVKQERVEYRALEIASLSAFLAWNVAFLAYGLTSARDRAIWLLVSHGLAGMLHVQITLSHFAMEVYEHPSMEPFANDFVRAQCLTSMDIDSTWLTHWFHGGHQYQVEHHLFPRIPRHRLTHVRERIEPMLAKHGVPLVSVSFWEANKMVIDALANTASKASSKATWFSDALNWRG